MLVLEEIVKKHSGNDMCTKNGNKLRIPKALTNYFNKNLHEVIDFDMFV